MMYVPDALRVLSRQGRCRGHGVAGVGREAFLIGLDATANG